MSDTDLNHEETQELIKRIESALQHQRFIRVGGLYSLTIFTSGNTERGPLLHLYFRGASVLVLNQQRIEWHQPELGREALETMRKHQVLDDLGSI